MIEAVARRLGYVPRRQLESSVNKLGETRKRVDDLRSALEKARASREDARRELADARQALDEFRKAGAEAQAKLERLTSECEQRVAAVKAEWGDRYAKRCAALEEKLASKAAGQAELLRLEWTAMEERVAVATEELGVAREHLMAVEVKLDILEGAANVLDRRLRAGRTEPREPGSPSAG